MNNEKENRNAILLLTWFGVSFVLICLSLILQNTDMMLIMVGQYFLVFGIYGYKKTKNIATIVFMVVGSYLIIAKILNAIFNIDLYYLSFSLIFVMMLSTGLVYIINYKIGKKNILQNYTINSKLIIKDIYKDKGWNVKSEYMCNNEVIDYISSYKFKKDIHLKIDDEIDILVNKNDYNDFIYLKEKENIHKVNRGIIILYSYTGIAILGIVIMILIGLNIIKI